MDADAPTDAEPVGEDAGRALPAALPSAVTAAASPGEDPRVVAAQQEERAARRMRQTVRDMLFSMLAVLGVVLVIWIPSRLHSTPQIATVDPAPVIAGARQAETWPVLAPVGLPVDWRATSARLETAPDGADIVHVGYLTPTSTYAGVEQSATRAPSFVRDATLKSQESGTSRINGVTWTRYESDDGIHRSLVRTADGATYVVVGTGDWAQVEYLTSTLRPG